jgi:pimeloyl-ACP methyl ester carboxylesterase
VFAFLAGCLAATSAGVANAGSQEGAPETPQLQGRRGVRGTELTDVELAGESTPWRGLEAPRAPGIVELRWHLRVERLESGARAIELPTCAGRGTAALDGTPVAASDPGPIVIPLSPGEHMVSLRVTVSGYERRVACGGMARLGTVEELHDGLLRLAFPSPHAGAGGGHAVVFVPPGHDAAKPGPLLVLLHPWNGSIWTYAAYTELLDEAAKRDVVLLFPSGLGNSLYTAAAEDEALHALDALQGQVAADRARISLAGASMGGAGATTIGFHAPDRFATITSFFGDSKYDLGTYVKAILKDEAGAHRVNALDVVENARSVPVWLVHGEDDRVSPIAQSEMLAQALERRGFAVRFDRAPGMGHAGALVARFARELVAKASTARAVEHPKRVTYRSVRAEDRGAYGVGLTRMHAGDAYVDLEAAEDGTVRVHAADNVSGITLAPGALGVRPEAAVVPDPGVAAVHVSWSAPVGAPR